MKDWGDQIRSCCNTACERWGGLINGVREEQREQTQNILVGRQFSVGLLNFCTNHEQSTGCLWPQIILSKMLIWTTALEDIVFLWSKGKTCLLSNIKGLGFLNSGFLHTEVPCGPLHDTPWELLPQNADTLTTAIVKNNKFLCL